MSISIPQLKDDYTASADTFNAPLIAIEAALNALDAAIKGIGDKSSVIVYDVPVSTECSEGSLVYFDDKLLEFKPAKASISDLVDTKDNGTYIESKESKVVGMVVSRQQESALADILISGRYSSSSCIKGCLDGNTEPGFYYLSSEKEGKATKSPGIVVQPVLTYLGGGEFIVNITHQTPYQYFGPVLRGVLPTSGVIKASVTDDGILQIGTNELKNSEDTRTPYAISNISGAFCKRTPVITDVHGMGGISVHKLDSGEVYITDNQHPTGKVYAAEYNLNGVKRSQDSLYTYFVFPSARSSSMTISSRLNISDEAPVNVGCWVDFVCNGTLVSSADVSLYVIPDSDDTDLPDAGSSALSTSIPISLSGNGRLLTHKTSESFTATGPCTVFATISINNKNTEDISVLRAGFTVDPTSSNLPVTIKDNDRLTASGIASCAINKDAVVTILPSGHIAKASSDDQGKPAYGIATRDCMEGGICEYTIFGCHSTSTELTVGNTYFVGLDGHISDTSPESPLYTQRVGRATGRNTIVVSIEEVIL